MIFCLPSAGRAGHREIFSWPDSFVLRERVFVCLALFRGCDIHAEE